MQLKLPHPFRGRAIRNTDLEIAVELFNICSLDAIGKKEDNVEQTRNDWNRPGFNVETDTHVVFDEQGKLVGFVGLWTSKPHIRPFAWGCVHPDYRGRGIGTYLVQWAEATVRARISQAPEGTRVALMCDREHTNLAAQELFTLQGYTHVRTFSTLVIEMHAPPPDPQIPPGIHIRHFNPETETESMTRTKMDTFKDHWGYIERPIEVILERWQHHITTDPDYDPTLVFVAVAGDTIVGVCQCRPKRVADPDMAWIDILGVRKEWRHQGLGLALLHHTFGEFYRRGKRKVSLGVDTQSLTGATRLYEKAGMQTLRKYLSYEKVLRPGKDLTTRTLEN